MPEPTFPRSNSIYSNIYYKTSPNTSSKMPRQSSRRAPVSRPSQARHASTMAAPRSAAMSAPQHRAPPPAAAAAPVAAAPQQPGLFANMASTAAGVAVGSAVGHTIGAGLTSMFGGSSSSAPVEQQQQVIPASSNATANEGIKSCEVDARAFTKCLDDNSGNMQICDWYLQQLKSCQEAARQY